MIYSINDKKQNIPKTERSKEADIKLDSNMNSNINECGVIDINKKQAGIELGQAHISIQLELEMVELCYCSYPTICGVTL